jgi:hypothetical protein
MCESAFFRDFRHSDITIKGNTAVREKNTTNYSSVCVMGSTVLAASGPSAIYRCKVKISKTGGMYLGIAMQQILRIDGFNSKVWSNIGHGNYIINSDGQTYSHSDKEVNYTMGDFTFGIGDVVDMEFDTKLMTLHFHCKAKERILAVAPPNNGDSYRFVVYLFQVGAAVELLRCE